MKLAQVRKTRLDLIKGKFEYKRTDPLSIENTFHDVIASLDGPANLGKAHLREKLGISIKTDLRENAAYSQSS